MTPDFRILELETVDSTNVVCRRHAEEGAAAGLVIRADRQTAGRGRRGRNWVSPVGNLYCSILLRPQRPANEAATLGFAAVVALGNVVASLLPARRQVAYKWPNDVLIDGRKVSGLLLEAGHRSGDRLAWLIIGLGVNIANHPGDTSYPATDLMEMQCEPVRPVDLLAAFLNSFGETLAAWSQTGFAAVRNAWMERAAGIGQEIEVRLEGESHSGRFVGLDKDGALMLELPTGTVRRISAGDVLLPGVAPAIAGR